MRVCLEYLGCRLNEAEMQAWSQQFIEQGFEVVANAKEVDLLVLNSCAVTAEACRKSRQHIRRLHRKFPTAKLVVTGCYASLEAEQVAAILGVDMVVPNNKKAQLVQLVIEQLCLNTTPQIATEPGESPIFTRNRTRAFIKIQDGCRYRCSYCIVTVARGEEQSRTISEIVDEINLHHSQGLQEIVLTGVHVGGYGSDLGKSLQQLVLAILDNTSVPRIRFASVEPWDLPESFFKLFENPRVMPHMHLPIQSGSDSVLRRMSRRCKTGEFSSLIESARKQLPEFNVTTDIIVGFPGETEAEWNETLEFVERQNFGHIHIFSFSPREGTKAARLQGMISPQIKKQRSQQLHQLAAVEKRNNLKLVESTSQEILLEFDFDKLEEDRYRYWGYTPNYSRVAVTTNQTDLAGVVITASVNNVNLEGNYLDASYMSSCVPSKNLKQLFIQQSFT